MKDVEYVSPTTAPPPVILSTIDKKKSSTSKLADIATPKKKDERDEWIRWGQGCKEWVETGCEGELGSLEGTVSWFGARFDHRSSLSVDGLDTCT
jgi:hypothetical protein